MKTIVTVTLTAFAFSTAASAQGIDRAAAQSACRADYQRFCANVPRGGGRIASCLRQNVGNLSPSCRAHVEKAAEPRNRRD